MAFWETPNRIELSEGNTLSLYCIKVFYMIRTTTRKQQQPQSPINSHFGAGEPVIPGKYKEPQRAIYRQTADNTKCKGNLMTLFTVNEIIFDVNIALKTVSKFVNFVYNVLLDIAIKVCYTIIK